MNSPRISQKFRHTKETQISLKLNLDGQGQTKIETGWGFLDHMLTLTAFWAHFDLELEAKGDLKVDAHHTTEDVGLVLGAALLEALGDRLGIRRVGYARVPMDEALAEVTLDLSGRPYLVWLDQNLLPPVIAHEEKDIWREFYKSLAMSGHFNLHVQFHYGQNGHHLLESAAKGLGLALAEACQIRGDFCPSTKARLD
ncbi:MAG: imidazoleglycerol-phosphate dehydratase HisB [Desulfovibrionaceae bacterium]|nr:imidazoleglycerol-phosphate dehydratase HisB [Desulfovibrionaceae bacterium]